MHQVPVVRDARIEEKRSLLIQAPRKVLGVIVTSDRAIMRSTNPFRLFMYFLAVLVIGLFAYRAFVDAGS